MKKNAVMYFNVWSDHRFRGLSAKIVLKCTNTQTFDAAFNELKDKLSSDEMVNYVIDECSLIDDLFDGDKTYKFTEIKRDVYGIAYVFVNSEGNQVEKTFIEEFVGIFN